MCFLEIAELPAAGLPEAYEPVEFFESGNTDKSLSASRCGLFWPLVEPGNSLCLPERLLLS